MKTTRLGVAAAGSALLLATTVATANAQSTVPSNAAPTVQQVERTAASYSGENLFQAFFLGTGPVAERYPNLVHVTPEASGHEVRAAAPYALAEIASADPTFFPWFKSGIISGNRMTIKTTLEQSPDRLSALLSDPESGGVVPGAAQGYRNYNVFRDVNRFYDRVVFIHYATFINRFHYVGADARQYRIVYDRWVNDIATTLR